jgi:hypothetical protein
MLLSTSNIRNSFIPVQPPPVAQNQPNLQNQQNQSAQQPQQN